MAGVIVWIDRPHPEGHREAEAHLGGAAPFLRWLRDPRTGKVAKDENDRPLPDAAHTEQIAALLLPYNGQNARDVALDLKPGEVAADTTGVLRALAQALADIAHRAIVRQQRAEQGKMRAVWLADFELAQMVVHVRAE